MSFGASTRTRLVAPILPAAEIGILGGGQLGRLIGLAALRLGYRVAVLDPDLEAPAMAVANRSVVAAYDDVDAALQLASTDVVTYELEHVSSRVVEALLRYTPVRPGLAPLRVSQDRLEERRWLESVGAAVAAWREVGTQRDLDAGLEELGLPCRLKASRGGYDGRGQLRISDEQDAVRAIEQLGVPGPLLLEREVDFVCELSVVCARGLDGRVAPFPVAENVHDRGILVSTRMPSPTATAVLAAEAQSLASHLAAALDVVGTLTAELFLTTDGSLLVNELAPRVHNSGHVTEVACPTGQFEQHVRAICGLPLGPPDALTPGAMVNLLGTGEGRPARLVGLESALADPAVAATIYDKRQVFERRKMGHLTARGASAEEALERAQRAVRLLHWAP